MKLSTMTNLFYFRENGDRAFARSVEMTAEAGFDAVDLCMCPMQRGECELCDDEKWESVTDVIGEASARVGLPIMQAHSPYAKVNFRVKSPYEEGCEKNEYFVKMMMRSIEVCGRLGIPWTVVHPVQDVHNHSISPDANVLYNREIFLPVIERANALGVGVAFENMADVDGKRRFGVTAEELSAICDAFSGARVGVCWDTGHANRSLADHYAQLRSLGDRLVCTHIDDNIGQTDLHTFPYAGTVKWEKVMGILREIGYKGVFNYELSVCKRCPGELIRPTVDYALAIGRYLLSL